MNPWAPIIAMFENVPTFEDEVVRGLGKEMPDNLILATGPLSDPVEWMKRSRIRYLHDSAGMKPSWAGVFRRKPEVGDCCIQTNPNYGSLSDPSTVRVLWHEIGHAIDHLSEEGELLVVRPNRYSTEHGALLEQHAAIIIGLRLHQCDASYEDTTGDWIAYARKPEELWAEAVAIAVCMPDALKPTALWPVLAEVLPSRSIAITLPAPASPEDDMKPKQPGQTGHGVAVEGVEIVGTAAEGAGNPLPSYKLKELGELVEAGKFPQTIFTILSQIGGFNLNGALTAVGCCCENLRRLRWRHPKKYYDGECRGSGAKWKIEGSGAVPPASCVVAGGPGRLDYDVGIDFPVNGAPGEWRMAVTYEPDDTYSVWLWVLGAGGGLIASSADIYCDMLDECIDRMYSRAIEDFNGGVIPSN